MFGHKCGMDEMAALAHLPPSLQVHAAMASEMLAASRPGCFNQAVMELGATVCRPVNPACGECPVRDSCRAHAQLQAYLKVCEPERAGLGGGFM